MLKFLFAWFRKLMSIFVSGKMIAFFATTIVSSYLIWHGKIESSHYRDIIIGIIGVILMRGVVEISEIKCNGGRTNGMDNNSHEMDKK